MKVRIKGLRYALAGAGAALALICAAGGTSGTHDAAPAPPPGLYWPPPPDTPRIQFLRCFGSPKDLRFRRQSLFKTALKRFLGIGDRAPHMAYPYGLTTDSRGRVIAVDSKLRLVHVFDSKNESYFTIESPGKDRLISPIGVAVDGDDNIYVSDSYQGKIFTFDARGKLRNVIGRPEGIFKRPTGLAIDKAGARLYVVDTLRNEVVATDLRGRKLFRFGKRGGGNGEFNFPTQICFKEGRLYVTDTLNGRIQVFDGNGTFLSASGRMGDRPGDFDKPKGIAVDSEGHVYVVDGLRDVVQIFDAGGQYLLSFGGTGSGNGEFYLPTAIHIDAQDNIYVADSYNSRIEVFKHLRHGNASAD